MQRDAGPHPAVRAAVGLALGLAFGAIVALLLPRQRQVPSTTPSARAGDEP